MIITIISIVVIVTTLSIVAWPPCRNDLIAGRYQVMDFLGSAAFSRAVQALDVKTGTLVCLKIIKVWAGGSLAGGVRVEGQER